MPITSRRYRHRKRYSDTEHIVMFSTCIGTGRCTQSGYAVNMVPGLVMLSFTICHSNCKPVSNYSTLRLFSVSTRNQNEMPAKTSSRGLGYVTPLLDLLHQLESFPIDVLSDSCRSCMLEMLNRESSSRITLALS
jgi:hypothetical protein